MLSAQKWEVVSARRDIFSSRHTCLLKIHMDALASVSYFKHSPNECCFSILIVSMNNEMDGFITCFFVVITRCWRVRRQFHLRRACHLQKHGRGIPVSLQQRVQRVWSGTDARRLVVLRGYVTKTRQFVSTDCHMQVAKVVTFRTVWLLWFY